MRKKYLQTFVNTVDKGTYTLQELFDEWKYFCESNILPRSTIAMFRINIESLQDDKVKILYDDNNVKIRAITIT